jgi:hypothetical protein
VDLLAIHDDVFGSLNSEADLITLDTEDGDGDIVTDHHRFVGAAGQTGSVKKPQAGFFTGVKTLDEAE